jgi:hypothetical protein
MEGIIQAMLYFLGLKVLLSQAAQKGEDMGKKNKRKKKYLSPVEQADQEFAGTIKTLKFEIVNKPFENIKLLPPRDAQKG